MSSEHTNTTDRVDRDLLEASPSTGYEELYDIFEITEQMDPDTFYAATRTDRSERYRRKHRQGVTT